MADRFSVESLLDEVLRGDQHAARAIQRIGPRRKRSMRHERRSSSSENDLVTLALAAGSPAEAAALIYSRIGAEQAAHLAVQLGGLEGSDAQGSDEGRAVLERMADVLEGLAAEQKRLRAKVRRYAERMADVLEGLAAEQKRLRAKVRRYARGGDGGDRYAVLVEKLARLEACLSQPRARVFERNKDGLITSYRDE